MYEISFSRPSSVKEEKRKMIEEPSIIIPHSFPGGRSENLYYTLYVVHYSCYGLWLI